MCYALCQIDTAMCLEMGEQQKGSWRDLFKEIK